MEALKTELEDSLDTTAAVQDLRNKRESELQDLKKTLEVNQQQHDQQVQDVKHKYNSQIENLNEEIENVKKVSVVSLGYNNFWHSVSLILGLVLKWLRTR